MDPKSISYLLMKGGIERVGEQAGRPGRELLEGYRVAWTRVMTTGPQRMGWVGGIFRCKFGQKKKSKTKKPVLS